MSEVKYYHDTKQLHHGERGNDDEESIQILLDHRDKKVLVLLAKRTERLISDFQEVKHGLKIGEMCCSKSTLPRTSPNFAQNKSHASKTARWLASHQFVFDDLEDCSVAASSMPQLKDPPEVISNPFMTIRHRKRRRKHYGDENVFCQNEDSDDERLCRFGQREIRSSVGLNIFLKCTLFTAIVAALFGVAARDAGHGEKNEQSLLAYKRHDGGAAMNNDEPNWYDRSNWQGQTYAEAFKFCESKHQRLCTYKTICPFGPGGRATSPQSVQSNLAWVPTQDAPNSWVQVGTNDHCLKYGFIHNGKKPSWGVTGEENEEMTRYLVCCPLSKSLQNANGGSSASTETGEQGTIPSTTQGIQTTEEQQVTAEWDPLWYDHTSGWSGSSFEEALDFCGRKSRSPCPYEAYCPDGLHKPPVKGGPNDQSLQSWSPIIDEIGHGVIQVGGGSNSFQEDSTSCRIYYLTTENGLRGKGLKSLMTHIMCCRLT